MENPSLIDALHEIRSSLLSTLRSADNFTNKLRGPRPESPSNPVDTTESVQALVEQIRTLASVLNKTVDEQHGYIGTFSPEKCAAQQLSKTSRYA